MPTIGPVIGDVDVDADVTLVTTAETVIATLSNISTFPDAQRVFLFGHAKLTTATSATSVVPRFRRGSLTGTVIGESVPITLPSGAGGTDIYDHAAVWTPGEIAGETVVFTLQVNAAAANPSMLDCSVIAIVGH